MPINFKPQAAVMLSVIIALISPVYAGDIEQQARQVSDSEDIEDFELSYNAMRAEEASLSGTVKQAIEHIGKLDQNAVAGHQYYTVLDELGTQFSKGKIQEITQLNNLIMDFQKSKISLMQSTAEYQEAKNKLSQQFERREDVLKRISDLENLFVDSRNRMIALQVTIDRLQAENESLKGSFKDGSNENANSSKSAAINKMLTPPEQNHSSLATELGLNPDDGIDLGSYPPFMLTGTSKSKGSWVATFMDTNKRAVKASAGTALAGGWTVVKVGLDNAMLRRDNTEHTLKRQ